jgi:manganese-dependent inorganic pyrophosphatase
MSPFYVIGHKNPDTDAICSAIGHAALLRATGEEPHAVAARCGDVSQRTAWVLQRAGVEEPPLVTDVRTTAGMICHREIIKVHETDTFLTAHRRMMAASVRSVPVMNDADEICGILNYIDLLGLLLPAQTEGISVRTVHVSLSKLADTLEATKAGAPLPPADEEEDLILLVGASSQEAVDGRLELAIQDGTIGRFLVICGDRPMVQRSAIDHGARALLVTGDNPVSQEIRDYAARKGVVVLLCHQDTASASTLMRCSRTVRNVMRTSLVTVPATEPVSRLRKRVASVDQTMFPVNDPVDGKMIGVLTKSDLVDPPRVRLALVDHNEYAQAVNGVEEAEVIEVIDHHRLAGDLVSREPIRYLNEPVGSTSTLVARKFMYRKITPEAGVAVCLCAGIVADTLCLTSPTTTALDREMLAWLAVPAGIEPMVFAEEFFGVGSLIVSGSPEVILNADRKEFTEEGFQVSISQVEERGLHGFAARRGELEQVLRELVAKQGFDLAVLAVTDIVGHHSMILAVGQELILSKMPFERIDDALFDAPGVVSRKKQLFPAVCDALHHAR